MVDKIESSEITGKALASIRIARKKT